MHRISNFPTADLHEEHQSALSIASASNPEGAIPQRFNVDLRQSLYRLTLGTMMELSVEDLLRNSCVIHTVTAYVETMALILHSHSMSV